MCVAVAHPARWGGRHPATVRLADPARTWLDGQNHKKEKGNWQFSDQKPEALKQFRWALNINTLLGLVILLLTSIAQAG